MFYFISGPHASGKSTICKRLLQLKCVHRYNPEVGRSLAESEAYTPFVPSRASEAFDLAVTESEIARDSNTCLDEESVTETWHPGNLLYVKYRNRVLYDRLLADILKRSCVIIESKAIGVILKISDNTQRARRNSAYDEASAIALREFYERNIDSVLADLKLKQIHYVDANDGLQTVLNAVWCIMKRHSCGDPLNVRDPP